MSETCTLSLSQFEGEMIGQNFMFFVTCQFEGGKSQILKKLREDEASKIEDPYYYGVDKKEAAECEGVSSGGRMNGGSGFADLAEPGYLVVACFSSSSLFYCLSFLSNKKKRRENAMIGGRVNGGGEVSGIRLPPSQDCNHLEYK